MKTCFQQGPFHSVENLPQPNDAKPYLALYLKELSKMIYSVATCIDGRVASLLHPQHFNGHEDTDVMVRSILTIYTLTYMRNYHHVLDPRTEKISAEMDAVWEFWER